MVLPKRLSGIYRVTPRRFWFNACFQEIARKICQPMEPQGCLEEDWEWKLLKPSWLKESEYWFDFQDIIFMCIYIYIYISTNTCQMVRTCFLLTCVYFDPGSNRSWLLQCWHFNKKKITSINMSLFFVAHSKHQPNKRPTKPPRESLMIGSVVRFSRGTCQASLHRADVLVDLQGLVVKISVPWWVIHGDGDPGTESNSGLILKRGGGFKSLCFFHPYLGKWSKLTNIFQMAWKPPTRKEMSDVRVEYGFDKWYSLLWSEFVDMGRGISCLWNTSTTKSKFEIPPSCLDFFDKKMQHIVFWDVLNPNWGGHLLRMFIIVSNNKGSRIVGPMICPWWEIRPWSTWYNT